MRKKPAISIQRIAVLSLCCLVGAAGAGPVLAAGASSVPARVVAGTPTPGACIFPTTIVGSFAQTAWMLFVAANCPANKGQVVWENWIEQEQLYASSGGGSSSLATLSGTTAAPPRRLHGSALTRSRLKLMSSHGTGDVIELDPSTECNPMQLPPGNVIKNAIVCEEVRLNPTAQSFIQSNDYQVRSGQAAAAQAGTNIQFPIPAVEVKVDWIPTSQFVPSFTCANPPKGVHVETIAGNCYAMAGMHILSKVLPNWLWATFEPQSLVTNPNRCIAFGDCNDPYGSVPPTSSGGAGGFTALSSEVQNLMTEANLAPEFANYRLDGVQVDFGTVKDPSLLGNSIIEGENAGLTAGQSSCITCHSVSSVKTDGTDGLQFLANQVGPQFVPPTDWIARDFVWSLSLACPGGLCP